MNPYLQDILHNITTRLAKLEEGQQKKEWVGLTGADLIELIAFTSMSIEDAKSVEAKLKEKNT